MLVAPHLIAALNSMTLDRQLAGGVDPQTNATLAIRARKLTGWRGRARVADGLAGAVRRATKPGPSITAAMRPDGRELLDARLVISALDRRLRGSGPVSARGVAMLSELLTDAASPLYLPSAHGELASRLTVAAAALDLLVLATDAGVACEIDVGSVAE